MQSKTLHDQVKDVARRVKSTLSGLDVSAMPKIERSAVEELHRLIEDLRLDVQDYEYADTRIHQLEKAAQARDRAKNVQVLLLKVSGFGLIGAADLAEISARIENINLHIT